MIKERICFAVLFVVEAAIAWFYCGSVFPKIKSGLSFWSSLCIGYGFLFVLSSRSIPAVNLLMFAIVNLALMLYNYKCSIKSGLLHAFFLTFVNGVSEVIVNLVLMAFGSTYNEYTYNFATMLALVILSKLLYLIIVFLAAHFLEPQSPYDNDPNITILLGIMPFVSVFVVVTIAYMAMVFELRPANELMVSISMLALLSANLAVLILYKRICTMAAENVALSVSKVQDEATTEYYKLLKDQYDNQRIMIHDIKKHLSSVSDMLELGSIGEAEQYLSELDDLPGLNPTIRLCDNALLNVILSRYIGQARELGISFSYNISSSDFSFMDATSITALFSNLLSNAVEAAQNSKEKRIELSITKNSDEEFILLSLSNSCDVAPQMDTGGFFLSTKDNPELHGYGQKSIERVVQKYDGLSMPRYDAETRTFYYTIRFAVS